MLSLNKEDNIFVFSGYKHFAEDFLKWYDEGKTKEKNTDKIGYYKISAFMMDEYEDIPNIDKVDFIQGEDGRWTRFNEFIFKISDRYFSVGYEQGLTECQENDYDDDWVYEVVPHEEVKVITTWREKK